MGKTGPLILLAVLVIAAAAVWLGLSAMAPERGAASDAALPVFLGAEGAEDVNEPAFGPGPTICSMDPRYRPVPGTEETCPVIQ